MNNCSSLKFGRETFVGKTPGALVDYYDVVKQLGKGGYGKVYEVKNKKTGEIRACKHLSKLNINDLEKFQREINILIKTDHPNIIKLYEVFESNRSLYLVMEECKGGELFDKIIEHIDNHKMYSERDAAEMLLQVMSAIEYCHNNGICHRDLKPENLLYLKEGDEENNPIKVIDFGLSQIINTEKKLKTKVGTAYYVAPEILTGVYNEKCDIWSAGVILYVLLSGDPPFNGPSDKVIYSKISTMKFTYPEEKWKNISVEAMDLINHMLSPEKERYTASQVIAHPWFNSVKNKAISNLSFDGSFFRIYKDYAGLKKLILCFIASRLKENEIENLKDLFKAFDKNNDGQISYNELEQGIVNLKCNDISKNDIQAIFNAMDTDKNGKIDYTEFIAATLNQSTYLKKERLYEAFSTFDTSNSGYISKDKIMKALKLEESDTKYVEDIIKKADKNNDGVIDYKEFLDMMGFQEK